MARPRSTTAAIARLLQAVDQPIYALDDDAAIIFINHAALEWLACTEDEILGQRCAYHSSDAVERGERLAASLCPPPEVFSGDKTAAVVRSGSAERLATFYPLAKGEKQIGVLAIVDAQDRAIEAAAQAEREPVPSELHRQIQAFRRQNKSLYRPETLLGISPVAQRIRAQVELATQCEAPVSISGPPGSGRQRTAATIHYAQGNAGPFVQLDCSALTPELLFSSIENWLARRTGEEPDTGTLVLGDVDALSPETQRELTVVLQAARFPLRKIATSRTPLWQLARHGRFSDSLAALLTAIPIELPPLSERRADLPLLAQCFLEENNARTKKQVAGFSPEALDRLDGYAWPGNLDELARVVTESHARTKTPLIAASDLPQHVHLGTAQSLHAGKKEEPIRLDEFLREVEAELLRRAMQRAKGNKARAARLLGLTRPRLYRRWMQLGLDAPPGGS